MTWHCTYIKTIYDNNNLDFISLALKYEISFLSLYRYYKVLKVYNVLWIRITCVIFHFVSYMSFAMFLIYSSHCSHLMNFQINLSVIFFTRTQIVQTVRVYYPLGLLYGCIILGSSSFLKLFLNVPLDKLDVINYFNNRLVSRGQCLKTRRG